MTPLALLELLHRQKMLAVDMPAQSPENLAWIGVYPLDIAKPYTKQFLRVRKIPEPHLMPMYRIRYFEVPRVLIERDVSIAEREMINKGDYFVSGERCTVSKTRRAWHDPGRI